MLLERKRIMYRYCDVSIRKFTFDDIPLKINWINDPQINKHLHYDIPLEYEKTCQWFEKASKDPNRFDATIEYAGKPIGIVGFTQIDFEGKCAEDYLVIGDTSYWGKGIATKAGILNTLYAQKYMKLDYLYGMIEYNNISSLNQAIRRGGKFDRLVPEYYKKGDKLIDAFKVIYRPEAIPNLNGVIFEDD